jgi:hypothetical protein
MVSLVRPSRTTFDLPGALPSRNAIATFSVPIEPLHLTRDHGSMFPPSSAAWSINAKTAYRYGAFGRNLRHAKSIASSDSRASSGRNTPDVTRKSSSGDPGVNRVLDDILQARLLPDDPWEVANTHAQPPTRSQAPSSRQPSLAPSRTSTTSAIASFFGKLWRHVKSIF